LAIYAWAGESPTPSVCASYCSSECSDEERNISSALSMGPSTPKRIKKEVEEKPQENGGGGGGPKVKLFANVTIPSHPDAMASLLGLNYFVYFFIVKLKDISIWTHFVRHQH
jgi:hypothetical protein